MKLQELYADDRAVSPVVGVALLIAMTVILAAVIGAVVLGIGVGPADAPQATLSFSESSDGIELSHNGGDALVVDEISVIDDDGDSVDLDTATTEALDDTMTSGQTVTFDDTEVNPDSVTVVWEDPESGSTTTLASYEA